MRIRPLCSHSEADLLGNRSRSSWLLPLEHETNVDRDHCVRCCDSKCSVAFQQTRYRHGEMQFSMAWRWRSGSVGRTFVSTPNYMYDCHTYPLRIVESLPLSVHVVMILLLNDSGDTIRIESCFQVIERSFLLPKYWSLITNAIFRIEFLSRKLNSSSNNAIMSVANANTYFERVFNRPSYFTI